MPGRDPLSPLTAALGAAALCAALLAGAAPSFAEEGEEGGGEADKLQQEIREQMEKVVRLMRENEAALLEASRGGKAEPKPVDVRPPDAPPAGMAGGEAGEEPPSGEAPPERAAEIRRRMEELIRGSTERGQSIPKELEELVRLIPLQGGGSQGQPDSSQPESEARRREREGEKPEDGEKKPEDGEPSPRDPDKPKDPKDDAPPPPSDPARKDVPPWLAELPDEVRRRVTAGDFEAVPAKYRSLIAKYQKWLSEQAGKTR